jgi:hypothetical protein
LAKDPEVATLPREAASKAEPDGQPRATALLGERVVEVVYLIPAVIPTDEVVAMVFNLILAEELALPALSLGDRTLLPVVLQVTRSESATVTDRLQTTVVVADATAEIEEIVIVTGTEIVIVIASVIESGMAIVNGKGTANKTGIAIGTEEWTVIEEEWIASAAPKIGIETETGSVIVIVNPENETAILTARGTARGSHEGVAQLP